MPLAQKATGTNLALVAVGAALLAASTLWSGFPLGGGVPITLQTLAVLLVGAVLGAYRGAAAVLVYLALGTAGLPIWAGHIGGTQIWITPRAGFLTGVRPRRVRHGLDLRTPRSRRQGHLRRLPRGDMRRVHSRSSPSSDGPTMRYEPGSPLKTRSAILTPFLPGDIIKAFVAAAVASSVHAAYPQILNPSVPHIRVEEDRDALASTA